MTDVAYITTIYTRWAKRYPIHYISVPILLPVGTFFALAFTISAQDKIYAISGPIVFSISIGTILYVAQWVGGDKMVNHLSLFATLPVSPFAYGFGIALSAAMNSIISSASILLLASAFYGLAITSSWILLVPTLLISFIAGSSIGFLIAWSSKDFRVISSTAQLVTFAFGLFAPVFYPIGALPAPLQYLARVIPTTYSAQLVRDSLTGNFSEYLDGLIPLLVITVLLLALVMKRVQWRQEE